MVKFQYLHVKILPLQTTLVPLPPVSTVEAFEIIKSSENTRSIRLHWSPLALEAVHGVNLSFVANDERNLSRWTTNNFLDFNDVSNYQETFQIFSHNEVMKTMLNECLKF